jgi:hypothetical protein
VKLVADGEKYKIYVEKAEESKNSIITIFVNGQKAELTQEEAYGLYADVWKAIAES